MKKIYAFIGSLLFSVAALGATFQYFNPAAGILKGNPSTYVTTAAVSSDILATFSGTCNSTTFMRGDGSCQTPPGAGGGTVNSVALSAPSVFSVTGSPITNTGTLTLNFATGQTANSFLATPDGTTGALSLRTIVNGDLPTVDAAHGGTGVATLTGIAKGNGTSAFTAAASSDVIATWTGTCSSSTFLRGDGSCQTPATGTGTVTSVALTVPSGFSVTGSPVTTSGTLAISGTLNPAAGGTGVATLTGIAKGNGTSAFTAAASGDVTGLWGGTCNSGTYLRGDGTCQTPPTGGTSANPTATIGLTAVNGSAGTFLRSDGAPALDQGIAPTWTGSHIFAASSGVPLTINSPASGNIALVANGVSGSPVAQFRGASSAGGTIQLRDGNTGNQLWNLSSGGTSTGLFSLRDGTRGADVLTANTTGNVIVNAPTSGQALTVNGFSGTDIARFSGANQGVNTISSGASAPAFFTPSGQDQWRIGAGSVNVNDFGIYNVTRSKSVVEISGGASGGNVTINAPSSGTALLVNQSGSTEGLTIQASGGGSAALRLIDNQTGTRSWYMLNGSLAPGVLSFYDATAVAHRLQISTAGNVTINAPSSGISFSTTGSSGSGLARFTSGNNGASGAEDVAVYRAGSTANQIQQGPNITLFDSTNTTVSTMQQSGGQTEFWQYNGGWNQWMRVSSGRNVTINTPSSSTEALTVNGAASAYTQRINANTGTGTSFGLVVNGGTNSSDNAFYVRNASGSTDLFRISGTGAYFVGTSGAGTSGQVLTSGGSGAAPSWTTLGVINSAVTFTATLTGMTSTTTGQMAYSKSGNIVCLSNSVVGGIIGTSNSTSFTITGVPAAASPNSVAADGTTYVIDNGVQIQVQFRVSTSGTITFYTNKPSSSTGPIVQSSTGFTASGNKGLGDGGTSVIGSTSNANMCYSLN